MGDINRQIGDLAQVLNSPTLADAVAVTSSDTATPIDIMVKRCHDATYIFAAGMRNQAATATFRCKNITAARAEVIGENRTIDLIDGVFTDKFAPYAVHMYRIR